MNNYDDLKKELSEIANVLEKFPDELKKQVFSLLVNSFLGGKKFTLDSSSIESTIDSENKNDGELPLVVDNTSTAKIVNTVVKSSSTQKKKPNTESFKIDRNLDLTASADSPSFKDFYAEKKPTSTAEFNALAVYYLIKFKGFESASFDQVYTCYVEVKKKPAEYFKQSFRDTQSKFGYIEINDSSNYVIPHRGVIFIEHNLPKSDKAKK